MTLLSDWGMSPIMHRTRLESYPGAMPQAHLEAAPLALNTCRVKPQQPRAVSLRVCNVIFLKIPVIMKKEFWHRVRVIGILFAFDVAIGPPSFTMAAGKNEARVTQAIRNVQLLAPHSAPRPASINDNIRPGTARQTGSNSN